VDLRQELTHFIEGFMSRPHFIQLISGFTDTLIQEQIVNGSGDVRDIDLVFKMLGIFTGA
jgi:hypothetical protein